MSRLNVLVTAASRRVPLVRAFREALDTLGVTGQVFVTDVNPLSTRRPRGDRAFPGTHGDRSALSPCRRRPVRAERTSASSCRPSTTSCRSSRRPSRRFRGVASGSLCRTRDDRSLQRQVPDLPTPPRVRRPSAESWLPADLPRTERLPMFVKPRGGRAACRPLPRPRRRSWRSSSTTCTTQSSRSNLRGPEFTLDVFCDFEAGRCRWCRASGS